MKKTVSCAILATLVAAFTVTPANAGGEAKPTTLPAAGKEAAAFKPVKNSDLKTLLDLDKRYQAAKAVTMNVEKTLKLGLLDQKRTAKGKLFLSAGKIRMELDGTEKSLLVVNDKNLWAITYPPAEFKDAAIQVIRGDTSKKKARSQSIVGLLSLGGFMKFFDPTGVVVQPSGDKIYFLQPKKEQTDFKRAQITLSKDGKNIRELRYWDDRDNETHFEFSDINFGGKIDQKLFSFSPPANSEVVEL